ncbi:hypothetical protein B484DRAFT_449396 [Ochromonadaceae sp. CCMP2298]|nr:hypothetical protein B484DRAFT_449396 [Ochromonadaceae sp. CCMP2298]
MNGDSVVWGASTPEKEVDALKMIPTPGGDFFPVGGDVGAESEDSPSLGDSPQDCVVESQELRELREHQQQIGKWLVDVRKKIYSLESSYLEDTQLGNIIRGWEIDGRPPLARGMCKSEERMFSLSSYAAAQEHRQGRGQGPGAPRQPPGPKPKKKKRRVGFADGQWQPTA